MVENRIGHVTEQCIYNAPIDDASLKPNLHSTAQIPTPHNSQHL
jgi:hypothetical protein